jgi:hypothetical protein
MSVADFFEKNTPLYAGVGEPPPLQKNYHTKPLELDPPPDVPCE